jgi:uncharacterized protein (DUF952 family)
MTLIYKIVSQDVWENAIKSGIFHGAAIDLQDGYIHMSDATQAEETAKRHFGGQEDLLLVAYDANQFGPELKWETSRGGALFPHIYASLEPARAVWAKPLPWQDGAHQFPAGWLA